MDSMDSIDIQGCLHEVYAYPWNPWDPWTIVDFSDIHVIHWRQISGADANPASLRASVQQSSTFALSILLGLAKRLDVKRYSL